jgi:hypothetical protein
LNAADRAELNSILDMIGQEVKKVESANPARLKRCLRNAAEISPDLFEVIVHSLANPRIGMSKVIIPIAEEINMDKKQTKDSL